MEKGIKSKRNLAISISVLTIVAVVIFIFSKTCVWVNDDIVYKFNLAISKYRSSEHIWIPIQTIRDIFESQWEHYFAFNGRYVAHWFVQLFCGLLGQTAFAIINALVYVAFIVLLLKLVGRSIRDVWSVASIALLLLLMYDTVYSPAFQIGFVWMFLLSIGWLYVFFYSKTKSIFACIGLFLFSIIAGQGHEALNIGVSGALIIYAITNRKSMTRNQWVMFFGFGIGALTLCLSPASVGRANKANLAFYVTLFNILSYLRVTYVFLIVLLVAKFRRQLSVKVFYKEHSFYINAMILLLSFNMIVGVYGGRQLMGVELMALILTLKCLPSYQFNMNGLLILTLIVSVVYVAKWQYISLVRNEYDDIVELYNKSSDGVVYCDIRMSKSRYICDPTYSLLQRTKVYYYMNKLFRSEGYDKELRVYPACLQSFEGATEVDNQVVEFDDGCFVVIQSKAHPAEFVLKREMNFGVYKRPFKDYLFTWDEPFVETDTYRANVIYEEIPFVDNIGVEILK